jgi:nitrite reductase/ring-hydroxylating ferredoxin subunit
MSFVRAIRERELREKGRALFRQGARQIALFSVGDSVHAVDNRCPHEGYPLLQGSVAAERGLLTCQWHNWKFDLATGDCVVGEDHLRRYPTRIEGGYVEVDLTDLPLEAIEAQVLRGLEGAIQDRQYGRIAREISRLIIHGVHRLDPLLAVNKAIDLTYDRFEFGTTHGYAALADWLSLYEQETDVERKVVCLTEALDHLADDALRQPSYPYEPGVRSFDGEAFLAAIEEEEEARAVSFVRGAVEESLEWSDLEPWYARAAFAHYNDFGHAAIYVLKTGSLLRKLRGLDPLKLLLPLTRMLCYATREDLLPDFRLYGEAAASTEATGTAEGWIDGAPLSGSNVKEALAWTRAGLARHAPLVLYSALLEAGAVNLLRFNETLQRASFRSVSRSAGWLDFTHTFTFGNALRELAAEHAEIWPSGLLQMACFVGRNKRFLLPAPENVGGSESIFARAHDAVLDHGLGEPIFSAHLVKTLLAVEREISHVSPSCALHLTYALNRFFSARIKEKHPLRTARQAIALVSNE